MFIKVNDDYALESDVNCWAISKWEINKSLDGGGRHRQILWYNSIEDAVTGLSRRMIRLSDANTIEDAIRDISEVDKVIKKAFAPLYKMEKL